MAKNSTVSYLSFILSGLGLIANVVAVGTTSWLISSNYLKMGIGVFRHCDFDSRYCGGMSEIGAIVDAQQVGWFRAVQGLFLAGCLGSVMTVALIGLVLQQFFSSIGTFKVIATIHFLTVVAESMAVAFFALHYRQIFIISSDDDYLGFSFYFAVLAVVFLFLAFLTAVVEASQTSKVLQNMQHRFTVWTTPYTLFVDQEP